jgi:hypothetical protein
MNSIKMKGVFGDFCLTKNIIERLTQGRANGLKYGGDWVWGRCGTEGVLYENIYVFWGLDWEMKFLKKPPALSS